MAASRLAAPRAPVPAMDAIKQGAIKRLWALRSAAHLGNTEMKHFKGVTRSRRDDEWAEEQERKRLADDRQRVEAKFEAKRQRSETALPAFVQRAPRSAPALPPGAVMGSLFAKVS